MIPARALAPLPPPRNKLTSVRHSSLTQDAASSLPQLSKRLCLASDAIYADALSGSASRSHPTPTPLGIRAMQQAHSWHKVPTKTYSLPYPNAYVLFFPQCAHKRRSHIAP